MKDQEIAHTYKKIRDDYRYDDSIFSEEGEKSATLKWIIDNKLTEPERIIIILYVDCHSYRKLADTLTLSHQTCAKEVRRIRKKIIDEYNKIQTYGREM